MLLGGVLAGWTCKVSDSSFASVSHRLLEKQSAYSEGGLY